MLRRAPKNGDAPVGLATHLLAGHRGVRQALPQQWHSGSFMRSLPGLSRSHKGHSAKPHLK